jgi:hypothetical protein
MGVWPRRMEDGTMMGDDVGISLSCVDADATRCGSMRDVRRKMLEDDKTLTSMDR